PAGGRQRRVPDRGRLRVTEGLMTGTDLRAALEGALAADPDDRAAHSAYADFLSESGAPADRARGEFIAVQLALEGGNLPAARRAELERRERALLEAHQRAWLGPLAPAMLDQKDRPARLRERGWVNHVEWRRGWLDKVYLWWFNLEAGRAL